MSRRTNPFDTARSLILQGERDAAAIQTKITELREATRTANLVLAETKDVLRQVRDERHAVDLLVQGIDALTETTINDLISQHVVAGLEEYGEQARRAAHDAYARVQASVDRLTMPILTLVAERTGQPPPVTFTATERKES